MKNVNPGISVAKKINVNIIAIPFLGTGFLEILVNSHSGTLRRVNRYSEVSVEHETLFRFNWFFRVLSSAEEIQFKSIFHCSSSPIGSLHITLNIPWPDNILSRKKATPYQASPDNPVLRISSKGIMLSG